MTQPHITYNKDGSLSSLTGREAVDLMRVATLMSAIKMAGQSNGRMVITRGFGLNQGLKMATEYTGVKYKRTEYEKAVADLKVWLETMKSTIPSSTVE